MNGAFYIDGIDIYARYGVVITNGGYNDLLCFPALKEPDFNDWPEEDGIEVDLDKPTLEAKEVAITFASNHPDFRDFLHDIGQPGYHILRITELDKEWRLRLLYQPAHKDYGKATTFSLKFADDFPDRVEKYPQASGSGVTLPVSEYQIDKIPLSRYGIEVIGGWDDLQKLPTVKKNLTRSFATSDGQLYDVGHLVYSSKETTLKCCLYASSMAKFWECYSAFFNDLIQPQERSFYWGRTEEQYPCYYKKSSGFNVISLSNPVAVEFSLTLVFTMFRINETHYILVAENGKRLVTEDGYYIDMKYYGS